MKSKKYDGYEAYSYLDEGVDYEAFELAPEFDRVAPYDFDLTDEQEERAQRLLNESLVISLHDHPIRLPADVSQLFAYHRTARQRTAYKALAHSGMDAVIDNFMDGTGSINSTSRMAWKWNDVIFDIGMRFCDIAHQDFVILGQTVDDIVDAHENGKLALIPGLECATMIENELDRIDMLYGLGIRQMGIAYSESNALGSGLREKGDGGLTQFGREAVERMNKVGMAIDISHSGDQTALDTIEVSERPVIITHAGARSVWNSRRMMPDEVIVACVEKGGVMGLEAAPHTTLSKDHPLHSIESIMDHFKYCVDLVGIENVSFGPDTMYGDHVGLHIQASGHLSIYDPAVDPSFERVEYVAGMENPSENFPNIVCWLVKHGYSDEEIKGVIGGNVLRVLRSIWE